MMDETKTENLNDQDSILLSVKSLLGIKDPSMTAFDTDLILHINSALFTLTQIGIGPSEGFVITGPEQTYQDFIEDSSRYAMVKIYLVSRVRLSWDPPQTGSLLQSLREDVREQEYRLNTFAETLTEKQDTEALLAAYQRRW